MSWKLPKALRPIAAPAAWAYGRGIAARNARFDRGLGIEQIDRPVISIGNITTGGTGKTPMTAWIARLLRDAGHRPAIAMRGYRARNGFSDEQAEYAQLIPEVPVIADRNRAAAIRAFLLEHAEIDCVLLDDGFQHRQLHRDLDLVLIDASAATFGDALLPAGNLREPSANLRRADAVIITHAPESKSEMSQLKSRIQQYHGRPPLAASRHVWTGLDVYESADARRSHETDWLKGKRLITMLGIGNPQAAIRQLEELGAAVARDFRVRDHVHYTPETLSDLETQIVFEFGPPAFWTTTGGCDALVVTHKDWVKLHRVIDWSAWRIPIVVPRLEIEVFEGERELRDLILSTANARKDPNGAPRIVAL